ARGAPQPCNGSPSSRRRRHPLVFLRVVLPLRFPPGHFDNSLSEPLLHCANNAAIIGRVSSVKPPFPRWQPAGPRLCPFPTFLTGRSRCGVLSMTSEGPHPHLHLARLAPL